MGNTEAPCCYEMETSCRNHDELEASLTKHEYALDSVTTFHTRVGEKERWYFQGVYYIYELNDIFNLPFVVTVARVR